MESQIKEKKKCLQIKDFNIDNLLIKLPRDIVGMKNILFFYIHIKCDDFLLPTPSFMVFAKKALRVFIL